MLGELSRGPWANLKPKNTNGNQLVHPSLNIRVLIGSNVEHPFQNESFMILEYIYVRPTQTYKSQPYATINKLDYMSDHKRRHSSPKYLL